MSQIITVTFAEGQREAIAAQPLEQWAYGQTLQFEGLDLPQAYRVDFSNFEYCGASIPRVGGPDGVAVPVEVLTSGRNVYAFIWEQDTASGARYRRATVRVVPGPEPDTDESPEEQSAVTEAINALNAAAEAIPEQVNAAVEEAISGGNFSGVFWATYGETTSAEIAAAVADAKLVATKRGGLVYLLTNSYSLGGIEVYQFVSLRRQYYGVLELTNDRWIVVSNNIPIPPVESPAFTGVPTAPTAPAGTNSEQLATTAFVQAAIEDIPEPGQTISEELKQALLQLARKVAYIDDQGETYYQDLYDALYPPAVLASIRATFAQGSTVIYNTDSLDVLKPLLTVTAVYDDGSTETVPAADYTLSGTLATGISTITVSYQGKTATFQVTVTAAPMAFPVTNNLTGCSTSNSAAAVMENEPYSAVITPASGYTLTGASVVITMAGSNITASAYSGGVISIPAVTGALVISVAAVEIVLSSITATYTQSGTVYDTDTLDSLKADLVVTAVYSDSSTATVAAENYALSGELTEGTSTITVTYGGKTATFDVTVLIIPSDYQHVEYIGATGTQYIQTDVITTPGQRRKFGFDIDCEAEQWHSAYNINMAAALDTGAGLWLGYINSVQAMGLGTNSGNYFTTGSPNDRHSYSLVIDQTTQIATCTRDDGATVTRDSTGGATNNNRTFCLFYFKQPTSTGQQPWYFYGKIYGCTLKKDGAVYRKYVPCYRKSDGVIGMYETEVGQFFTNSGTGTFTKGADVA